MEDNLFFKSLLKHGTDGTQEYKKYKNKLIATIKKK